MASIVGATSFSVVLTIGGSGTAWADPIASCSTTVGVIVAVNFSAWGGDVERGCDATLTTGYDALQAAGFTTAGDNADGTAFICRIDDEPPPSQDPCITTPPASAYWSYWHADAGQDTWTFSQQGAMSYHPLPGSVDAWTFGAGSQPPFPPSAVMATNTDPVGPGPTTTTSATPTGSQNTSPTTAPAPSSTATTSAGPSSAKRATEPTTTSPRRAATPSSTTASAPPPSVTTTSAAGNGAPATRSDSAPKIVDIAGASARKHNAGSPVAFAIGAAVVAVVIASGAVVAWRRREAH